MSLIDFKQEAQFQGCLHIAVAALDDVNSSLYVAVCDRLCSLPPVQLSGTVLFLRFIKASEMPSWSGKGPRWEEFAAHKQIVGLLGIAQCSDIDDVTNAKACFKATYTACKSNLCEAKCIVYGPKKKLEECIDSGASMYVINNPVEQDVYVAGDVCGPELEEMVRGFAQDICSKLNVRINHLERMLNQTGRSESLPLLKSPFESREVLAQEEETNETRPLSRNHMISRLEKHLGDLYLLMGQLQQASAHYRTALPSLLKNFKDWLWAGSVYEGLCVTAIITKECEEVLGQKAQGTAISGTGSIFFKKYTQRGSQAAGMSSSVSRTSSTIDSRRKAPAERLASDPNAARLAKYATTRKAPSKSGPGDISRTESEEGLVMKAVSPQPATPLQLPVVEEDSGLLDIGDEMDGVMESMQYEVEGDGEGDGEGEEGWFIDSRLLQKDFIAKQYSLALFTYKKAGDPGCICQIEALLKFARYLAKQKKTVKAAETLQRILKIDSRLLTDQDRVDLYITIAEVYKSINFNRKAAMFTYYAARWVISNSAMLHTNIPNVLSHNLVYQANSLLVNCLPGFKLSSNLEDLPKQTAAHIGWPSLQAYVLKDFVFTSRELQKDIEAINHCCYLLQVLHRYLPDSELHELTTMLADIVQEAHDKAKVNPMFAASMKGRLCSPLPLVNFPLVHSFQPKPLVDHLNPYKMKGFTSPALHNEEAKVARSGPFIYTPIGRKKKDNRPEVVWVEEEPGEIAVEIVNPLPYDLKVEKMTVQLEGVITEMYPSTLVLPPGEPQSFVLACIPKEPGLLSILGYKTVVFGIENECEVKIPGDPVVRVVPQLPQLRVKVLQSDLDSNELAVGKSELEASNGMKRKMSRASIDRLELMDGESCLCDFLLESSKQSLDVESLTVSIKDYNQDYCQFSFDQDHINSLLPITKSNIASFKVSVLAKIPSWFRVINDSTSSFTRKAVGLFEPTTQTSIGTPESSLKSEFYYSSNNSTPSSSPTPKRTRGAAHGLLPFKVPIKRKSSDSAYSSYNQESMTLESLDLHIPHQPGQSSSQGNSPTRYHNSLGRNIKPPKSGQKRAFDDVEAALDGIVFNMDRKRASVRSDPGDREESKLSRFTFRKETPLTHSETKPVAIPKSETAAGRLSDMSNGGSPLFFTTGGGGGGGGGGGPSLTSGGVLFGAEAKTQSLVRGLKGSGNKGKWHNNNSSTSNTRYISNPIGPLYKENLRPPSRVRIVGEFCLEYSGGRGLQEGFCRECRANVQIMVKPVLTFEQFDVVLVDGSQSLFELSFTMTNISKLKLNVTCKVNQDGLVECGGTAEQKQTLDPGASQKMRVSIKRFVVQEPPGSVKNESYMAKLYSERLSQIIQFAWQEVNRRKQGVITLEGLHLATSCVSLMRPVPLRFEVNVNGRNFVSKGQNSFIQELKIGEPFKVSLTLINNSGLLMPTSYLVLDPYQFSEELKRIVKDLRGKMVTTSCLVTKIPELEPSRFYVHEVTLVFLQKGNFQLDIKNMTPIDDPRCSTGSSIEPHSRTSSITEASMSKSPIKRASKPDSSKNRPSKQQRGAKSTSNRSSGGESSPSSGGVNLSVKEKNIVSESSKSMPTSPLSAAASGHQKKSKPPPVFSQGARRHAADEDATINHRTSSINELSSILPNVARMVSMIEERGAPPPVPTSARPKLRGVAIGNSIQSADRPQSVPAGGSGGSDTSSNDPSSGGSQKTEKKSYPIITGSSALAKPVPVTFLNPSNSAKSPHSDNQEKQQEQREHQQQEQQQQHGKGSTVNDKSSSKHKRLGAQRMESVILLSSHSRSQNLWNARLQNSNSVRLLSGPHFTFNVT